MAMRDRVVQRQRLFTWTWGLTPKTLTQARSRRRKDLTADIKTIFTKTERTLEDGTVRVGHWCEICKYVLPHIHTSSLHGVHWCLTCGLAKEIWQRKRCVVCRFDHRVMIRHAPACFFMGRGAPITRTGSRLPFRSSQWSIPPTPRSSLITILISILISFLISTCYFSILECFWVLMLGPWFWPI